FFLDEKFFAEPPDFADVYLMDGDALIYMREYERKDVKLSVIYQTRFCGNLITVFSQGGVYLSAEGAEYSLTPLPLSFLQCRAEEKQLAGRAVLVLYGGNRIAVISDSGKLIFLNAVESAEFGEDLKVCAAFETCTAAKAECVYGYDGQTLSLKHSKTIETRQPEDGILHFAFFESVLCRGNFEKYLDDELKARAGDILSYLNDFVSVTVPTEKFYAMHGDIPAAGLVYPKGKNLFDVKYFKVELNGGKISNISPIE
ncbi:MAG: hypothetical protein K2G96_03215, partial [Clostridia bacterium]|nr:hypothetical protein [Clostridia bacterium]